jgi:hypothetical protein
MSHPETNGLRFLAGLLLDQDELQWSQDEIRERIGWRLLAGAHEVGWVGDYVGPFENFGWEVYDSGSGVLATRNVSSANVLIGIDRLNPNTDRPSIGIDSQGRVLEVLPNDRLRDTSFALITVPNDGVWRTLVARYAVSRREPGRLTLTGGSVSVVGVGTQFTRYGDSTDSKASILRIAAADTSEGNDGEYEIDTITDDENLTLVSAPPATESSVRFRLKGRFFAGDPADPDSRNIAVARWELITRTTTRPTDGALIAYDVRRSGGVVTLIDRKKSNIYQPKQSRPLCYGLQPAFLYYDNANDTLSDLKNLKNLETNVASANTAFIGLSMAPCASGSHLTGLATDQPTGMMVAALWDNNTTRTIRVFHHTVAYGDLSVNWDDPDGGASVDVVAATGIKDVALLALPASSGNTHACFYADTNGSVLQKLSTDNGATWSAATTIWNPAGAETVDRISAVLTRMGRIVIVAAYSTGNRLRYIFSDDLAATWSNNTQAGFGFTGSATAAIDVSVVEDDRGNLWTIAAVAADNLLRLWRGQSEGNPAPDSDEQSDGWPVGPDTPADSVTFVDAVAMPNGTLSIVCDVDLSGTRLIYYVSVARRNVLHQQILVRNANDASGDYPVAVCLGVCASGQLFLGWGSKDDTGAVFDLDLYLVPYSPIAIERSLTWYGGI